MRITNEEQGWILEICIEEMKRYNESIVARAATTQRGKTYGMEQWNNNERQSGDNIFELS